jgi:hypothetical protein
METKISDKAPHQLLVEGTHDKYVVIHLMERHGLRWEPKTPAPYVRECKSYQKLLSELPGIIKGQAYTKIGVMLDADTDVEKRWTEIQKSVGVTFDIGSQPEPGGLIRLNSKSQNQKLGIWLMPDNSLAGALEGFVRKLVPSQDPTWEHAEASVATAQCLGARFDEKDRLKATLHTWLAWRKEPGVPYGRAISSKYLEHDTPEALQFIGWFCRLYDISLPTSGA